MFEEPVFEEPWQAQAFALAVQLNAQGAFTWAEWASALGAQIARQDGRPYYDCWLAALETLALAKGLAGPVELNDRRIAWREAYLHTPHGQPVLLPSP